MVNVQTTNGPTNIHTQAGTDTINIGSLTPVIEGGIVDHIQGAITVYGDGNDTLNVDDTGTNYAKTGTLTSSSLTGLNMTGITYNGLALLNVSLGSGGNTLTVASTFPATTTNINLQRNAGATTITTVSGTDFINIGSLAPGLEGGIVNYIQAPVTVVADRGADTTMNVDDTGSTAFNTENLTSTKLTGLGMVAGNTYSGLAILNLSLGSGGNDLYVSSTQTGTITNINLQRTNAPVQIITITGVDFVNIGALAPASGGIVNGILAPVTVSGDGGDILNVDDTGSTGAKTGTLTSNTLTGLGMGSLAGIAYGGQASLNISLGSGANTVNILSTYFATTTTLKDGLGNDTVNIQSTSGPTNIVTQSGGDVINIGSRVPSLAEFSIISRAR